MPRDDADRLRGVDRRAAAEADEPVAPRLGVHLRARVDERDVRIRSHLVEDDRVVEVLERALGEARRGDARVRHEQRTRHAELAQRLAQPAIAPAPWTSRVGTSTERTVSTSTGIRAPL